MQLTKTTRMGSDPNEGPRNRFFAFRPTFSGSVHFSMSPHAIERSYHSRGTVKVLLTDEYSMIVVLYVPWVNPRAFTGRGGMKTRSRLKSHWNEVLATNVHFGCLLRESACLKR